VEISAHDATKKTINSWAKHCL